jgi:hypothetical protein
MSYEAASRLATAIRQARVPCSIVAASSHSFVVAIMVPQHRDLFVFSSHEWEELRSLLAS